MITLGLRKNSMFYSRGGVEAGQKIRLRLHPENPGSPDFARMPIMDIHAHQGPDGAQVDQ